MSYNSAINKFNYPDADTIPDAAYFIYEDLQQITRKKREVGEVK